MAVLASINSNKLSGLAEATSHDYTARKLARLGSCWGLWGVAKGGLEWREVEQGSKFYSQMKILFRRGRGSTVPGALVRACGTSIFRLTSAD